MVYTSNRHAVDEKVDRAIMNTIDRVHGRAVGYAKSRTPVRTGTAQGSIMFKAARRISRTLFRGEFGSYNVKYFIWLEIGARGRSGLYIIRRAADQAYAQINETFRDELRKQGL
jgi:hypothetical protein